MAIVETKADEIMALIDKSGMITTKAAAEELKIPEQYVRRIALAMQKNKLIDLNASAFKLTMVSKNVKVEKTPKIARSLSAAGSS